MARSITGDDLTTHLHAIAADRGLPEVLRCDNDPKLICHVLASGLEKSPISAADPSARCAMAHRVRGVLQQ